MTVALGGNETIFTSPKHFPHSIRYMYESSRKAALLIIKIIGFKRILAIRIVGAAVEFAVLPVSQDQRCFAVWAEIMNYGIVHTFFV